MYWTRQVPTKPGWYWYRVFRRVNVWYVFERRGDLFFYTCGEAAAQKIAANYEGEWAGPIPMPKEEK